MKRLIAARGANWEEFSLQLKEEYSLEDADRVTKKSFMEWVNKPNKDLVATELFREFERQFLQLSRMEKLTLENDKVELFLQSANSYCWRTEQKIMVLRLIGRRLLKQWEYLPNENTEEGRWLQVKRQGHHQL